jgi:holin-like protein
MKHIKTLLLTSFKFSVSLILLLGCLFISKQVTAYFDIPFPSALIAMIVLFLLLLTGIIKEAWIAPACQPILKYMALFFIPAGVGLVEHLDAFIQHWPLFLLVLLFVPMSGLLIVSKIANSRGQHAE